MSLPVTYFSRIKNLDGFPSHWLAVVPILFSRSLSNRMLGMPQERLLPNAVVQLNCTVLQTFVGFQTLQCQSAEWSVLYNRYNSAVSACSSAPWARVAELLSCNSAASMAGYCWLILMAVVDPVGKLFGSFLKCGELCLQIFCTR